MRFQRNLNLAMGARYFDYRARLEKRMDSLEKMQTSLKKNVTDMRMMAENLARKRAAMNEHHQTRGQSRLPTTSFSSQSSSVAASHNSSSQVSHSSSSREISYNRPQMSSQSSSFLTSFVVPHSSQMRTPSLSSQTVSQSEVSTLQSLAKHLSTQVSSEPVNLLQPSSDDRSASQFGENAEKFTEGDNLNEEKLSVVAGPEIGSTAVPVSLGCPASHVLKVLWNSSTQFLVEFCVSLLKMLIILMLHKDLVKIFTLLRIGYSQTQRVQECKILGCLEVV